MNYTRTGDSLILIARIVDFGDETVGGRILDFSESKSGLDAAVDMCIDMHINMYIAMCIDMCIDMRTRYDTMVWAPIGRPVGTTIYPGMQVPYRAILIGIRMRMCRLIRLI